MVSRIELTPGADRTPRTGTRFRDRLGLMNTEGPLLRHHGGVPGHPSGTSCGSQRPDSSSCSASRLEPAAGGEESTTGARRVVAHVRATSPYETARVEVIDPSSLELEDLGKLPILRKDRMMEHWDEIVTDARLSSATSGAEIGIDVSIRPGFLRGPGLSRRESRHHQPCQFIRASRQRCQTQQVQRSAEFGRRVHQSSSEG